MYYDIANELWFQPKCISVGENAFSFLQNESYAKIIGLSSKGIFLKTLGNHIIFLSSEKFTGPLTINITDLTNQKLRFRVGQKVRLSEKLITILNARTIIRIDRSMIRTMAVSSLSCVPIKNCYENLSILIRIALENKKLSNFSSFLPNLLDFSTLRLSKANYKKQHLEIIDLIETISAGSTIGIVYQLAKFLGNGSGLTPSGDDLILGVTLLINRWTHILDLPIDVNLFNEKIIGLDFSKTTLLSENLIACATNGRSDERIEAMADAIFLNKKYSNDTILSWMNWGGTSSTDVLLGMGILLTGFWIIESELMN